VIFVGIDWSETHYDVCVLDVDGGVLTKGRVPEGVEGLARLHEMLAAHAEEPSDVVIGIELDRGLLVGALVATGYAVHAVNPLSVDRYRDRHRTSGAKSDPGDARVLADLVRTDRHLHRQVAGDTDLAEAVKVLARAHQSLIWSRQREVNRLRSALREFYPAALQAFGTDLASSDALAVLGAAPTPAAGRSMSTSRIAAALRRGGRTRRANERAEVITAALRSSQLEPLAVLSEAYGALVRSTVRVVAEMTVQIEALARGLQSRFEVHPDAEILRSLPGLGLVLGARVLAEFGDDPTRYADPKARKNYAGTSPITRALGALQGGARPVRPEPPTCGRPRDVGVLLDQRLPRGSSLLRHPADQGPWPSSRTALTRQPVGRHLARVSPAPKELLGGGGVARGRGGRRLTLTDRGISSPGPWTTAREEALP